jgi:hypothetical protein
MHSTPSRAEWCRLKAGECEALAAVVTDGDAKRELRQLARQWLDLMDLAGWLDQRAPDWISCDRRHLH